MTASAVRWLEKAKRHLSTAHLNHTHGGFSDTTCYFAHQAVELALKGYLVAKNVHFPRVHTLPQLISLCIQQDSSFTRFADDAAFLNGFYIEAKYPLDVVFDPTEQDVSRCIAIADAVIPFINSLTPSENG